jgi:hypothetical protein
LPGPRSIGERMPPPSKIDLLPEDVRAELDRRLIKAAFGSSVKLSEWLAEQGFEISKTTVNERAKNLKRRLSTIVASTDAARMIADVAPDEPADRSNSIIAMLQSDIFETMLSLQQANEEDDPIKRLAILGNAAKHIATLTRASIWREQHASKIRDKILLDVSKRIDAAATARGLGKEDARFWREQVLEGL